MEKHGHIQVLAGDTTLFQGPERGAEQKLRSVLAIQGDSDFPGGYLIITDYIKEIGEKNIQMKIHPMCRVLSDHASHLIVPITLVIISIFISQVRQLYPEILRHLSNASKQWSDRNAVTEVRPA